MRVKIDVKRHGIEKLEFGKRYFIAFVGTTYGYEFLFTRKNTINIKTTTGESISVSRRELKQILNSELVHWVSEVD